MEDVAHVAKEEITRQAIILFFSSVGVLVSLLLVEAASDPDRMRTIKMGTALATKRLCQKGSDKLQEWADKAATTYNQEKA